MFQILLAIQRLCMDCKDVRLSLEPQRDRHLQQQRLIKMSRKHTRPLVSSSKHTSAPITALQSPPLGWKAAKDDKTRLEEQSTATADLRELVVVLLLENKRLLEEHEKLKAENASLKRELYEEHQSPQASLDQPLPLGMRLLNVPPDIQQEIQLLLKTSEKLPSPLNNLENQLNILMDMIGSRKQA
uniref:Nuclear receptor-binding factor 2 C-terminal domain-containing protein n=1 Tax=Cyprinus carpio TaxID=7962 RepID=A0A8C2KA66_CYPCA